MTTVQQGRRRSSTTGNHNNNNNNMRQEKYGQATKKKRPMGAVVGGTTTSHTAAAVAGQQQKGSTTTSGRRFYAGLGNGEKHFATTDDVLSRRHSKERQRPYIRGSNRAQEQQEVLQLIAEAPYHSKDGGTTISAGSTWNSPSTTASLTLDAVAAEHHWLYSALFLLSMMVLLVALFLHLVQDSTSTSNTTTTGKTRVLLRRSNTSDTKRKKKLDDYDYYYTHHPSNPSDPQHQQDDYSQKGEHHHDDGKTGARKTTTSTTTTTYHNNHPYSSNSARHRKSSGSASSTTQSSSTRRANAGRGASYYYPNNNTTPAYQTTYRSPSNSFTYNQATAQQAAGTPSRRRVVRPLSPVSSFPDIKGGSEEDDDQDNKQDEEDKSSVTTTTAKHPTSGSGILPLPPGVTRGSTSVISGGSRGTKLSYRGKSVSPGHNDATPRAGRILKRNSHLSGAAKMLKPPSLGSATATSPYAGKRHQGKLNVPPLPSLHIQQAKSPVVKQGGGTTIKPPSPPASMNLGDLESGNLPPHETSSSQDLAAAAPASGTQSDSHLVYEEARKAARRAKRRGGGGQSPHSDDGCGNNNNNNIPSDPDDPRKNIVHKRRNLLNESDSAKSLLSTIAFDELKLKEVIGGGGFGQVWRATWRGTPVAVKILTGSAQRNEVSRAILEEFAAEINMLKGMRHPNICLYMGACLDPPNRAIITELAANGSLWDALRLPLHVPYKACNGHSAWWSAAEATKRGGSTNPRALPPPKGTWPWILVKRVAYGAARGMTYLHSGKPPVLHRDLKSANLLLDESYTVKVCDFGLSRLKAQQNNSMTGNTGTVQWMSPEILASKPYAEPSDVYSFGIILWELLTRECPYEGMTAIQCAMAVLNRDYRPEIPSWCPEEYDALYQQCVHRDPKQRPTFEQVLESLDEMP